MEIATLLGIAVFSIGAVAAGALAVIFKRLFNRRHRQNTGESGIMPSCDVVDICG
jgi:hypothetical protein